MVQLLARAEELARDETVRATVLTGRGRAFSTDGVLRMVQDAVERFADPADTEARRCRGSGSATSSARWCA